MTGYDTPGAWRRAIEDRLDNKARATKVDLGRLRRRLIVERMFVRLESAQPGRWVMKGGMALELRLGRRARATRDLDVAVREATEDAGTVRENLVVCFSADPDGDRFEFIIGDATDIQPDEAGRPGWRFPVEARLAGRVFDRVRLEVVSRDAEISGTERLVIPSDLSFAGIGATEIEVVDRGQHFAEKLHAFTRDYGDRLNSRVRDLPDMLVLIQDGLAPDGRLLDAVNHVFEVRGTHSVPVDLPDPPVTWHEKYVAFADELDIPESTIDEAMVTLRGFWSATRESKE